MGCQAPPRYWKFHVMQSPFLFHYCNKSKKSLPKKNLSTPLYRKDDEWVPFYGSSYLLLQVPLNRLPSLHFYQFIIFPHRLHFYEYHFHPILLQKLHGMIFS